MPYIETEMRPKFKELARQLGTTATCGGDLNYIFTEIVHAYIKQKGLRYVNIESVTSALDLAKLEFYARVARPYEDKKALENGDVGLFDN